MEYRFKIARIDPWNGRLCLAQRKSGRHYPTRSYEWEYLSPKVARAARLNRLRTFLVVSDECMPGCELSYELRRHDYRFDEWRLRSGTGPMVIQLCDEKMANMFGTLRKGKRIYIRSYGPAYRAWKED